MLNKIYIIKYTSGLPSHSHDTLSYGEQTFNAVKEYIHKQEK